MWAAIAGDRQAGRHPREPAQRVVVQHGARWRCPARCTSTTRPRACSSSSSRACSTASRRLNVFLAEIDCGWLPYYAQQCDDNYRRHSKSELRDVKLARMPSEYMKERFPASFITDPYAVENRHAVGIERMLWSSDFPHITSDWPYSWKTIERDVHGRPRRRAPRDPRRERATSVRVRPLQPHGGRPHRARRSRRDPRRHRAAGQRVPPAPRAVRSRSSWSARRTARTRHGRRPRSTRCARPARVSRSSCRTSAARPAPTAAPSTCSATSSTTASTPSSGRRRSRGRNGHVGLYGTSYGANTSWQAAIADPPALGAIAPTQAPIDYVEGWPWLTRDGILKWGLTLNWTLAAIVESQIRRHSAAARARRADGGARGAGSTIPTSCSR